MLQDKMNRQTRRSMQFLKDYMKKANREPLIGLEYVMEYRVQTRLKKIETKYICEICKLNTDLIPMIEHLCGFKHRKHYIAKEYPFVLKTPSNKNEDRAQFMRRMALEIEQEIGTKMYKIDPATKIESLLDLQIPPPKKQRKKKSRWENTQNRVVKAQAYLETFNIDSQAEATIVTNLSVKLTAALKAYTERTREENLFTSRVAKAKSVANSLIKNANMKNKFLIENLMSLNIAKQGGLPINSSAVNMQAQRIPHSSLFLQQSEGLQREEIAQAKQRSTVQNCLNIDDAEFFRKLMLLLNALPSNTQGSENEKLLSELMTLKSRLLDKTPNNENAQLNQEHFMQKASLTQVNSSADLLQLGQNLMSSQPQTSVNQELMMLMTSQNCSSADSILVDQKLMMHRTSMANKSVDIEDFQLNQYRRLMLMDQNPVDVYPADQDTNLSVQLNNRFRNINTGNGIFNSPLNFVDNQEPSSDQHNPVCGNPNDMIYTREISQNQYLDRHSESGRYADSRFEDSYNPSCIDSSLIVSGGNSSHNSNAFRDELASKPYTRLPLSPNALDMPNEVKKDILHLHTDESRVLSQMPFSNSFHESMQEPDLNHMNRNKFPNSASFAELRDIILSAKERQNSLQHEEHRYFSSQKSSGDWDQELRALQHISEDTLKRTQGNDLFTASTIFREYSGSR
ncbi:hypothetical protein GDO86_011407 [Hymenochirus boettgeri]|uniref:Uncharacterized protein n=1 Tax=Hymenochirus boettgeri TaxID=247094 RepID=A0A8T2JJE0_9PIPI|nr:hypothetical protein GDO86_011407 [Hymenochirus boettgeri]KAG8442606.1 hypothetical protein GDO86_011407 [Hymenochirus boettgeri]